LLNTCHEYFIKINKPANDYEFSQYIKIVEQKLNKSADMLFDAIEGEVRSSEDFVTKQRATIEEINRNINWQKDYKQVIDFLMRMVHNLQGAMPASGGGRDGENPGAQENSSSLTFFAGTINHSETERMKKMLFRSTRGLALTHFDLYEQDGIEKSAYLVVFSGLGGNHDRVKKICDSFMGQRFDIPDMNQLDNVKNDITDKIRRSEGLRDMSVKQLKDYLYDQNKEDMRSMADVSADISVIEVYKWYVAKEKAIYHALNLLMPVKQVFIGYMWVPSDKANTLSENLREFTETELRKVNSDLNLPTPPSSYKTNEMLEFH